MTSNDNIIHNFAPSVWLSIQTPPQTMEQPSETLPFSPRLHRILTWSPPGPHIKLTSCYRAAVSTTPTAAVSCSDDAAPILKRRAASPGYPSSSSRVAEPGAQNIMLSVIRSLFLCRLQLKKISIQNASVFLCRRVSLDDLGKLFQRTIVSVHYVRQQGTDRRLRLIWIHLHILHAVKSQFISAS